MRIGYSGIRTGFDVVNCQYGCFLLCCSVKRVSAGCDHGCRHVLELECPVLPRCCLGNKDRQLRKCSRFGERSALSWCRWSRFPPSILPLLRSGSRGATSLTTELATQPPPPSLPLPPALPLSLSLSLSELRLFAVLSAPTAVATALAVEPANCWRFVTNCSMVVLNRLEVRSQNCGIHNTRRRHRQCPRVRTCIHPGIEELTINTLLRFHDAIWYSCNRAKEFESGCEEDMNCACSCNARSTVLYRMTRNKICARFAKVLFWAGIRVMDASNKVRLHSVVAPPVTAWA